MKMSTAESPEPFPETKTDYGIQNTTKTRKKLLTRSSLKMIGATLCIAGAVITWVAMAEALQKLSKEYRNPYFMIYFVHSSYSLLYVVWAVWRYFPYCSSHSYSCNAVGEGALTNFKSLIIWSGILGVITLVSGYTWYCSLPKTSIPANTSIYQSAAALVFVISVPLLKERVTVLKILCVLLSIGGVFIVAFFSTDINCPPPNESNVTNMSTHSSSYSDKPCNNGPEKSTPLGYVLLVVSVLTYASFETLYKRFATKKDDQGATLNGIRVLGYIGVHSLLWMWPPIIILHYSEIEIFHFPPTLELFGLLVLNALMDIVFNGCLVVCIALSSPLYASVGTIVAIPASVVVDLIVQHFLPAWQVFVGIILILCGFSGFVISEFLEIRKESKHQNHLSLNNTVCPKSGSDVDKMSAETKPLLSAVNPEPNKKWWTQLVKYLI